MAEHTDDDDNRCEQEFRCNRQDFLESRIDIAGPVSNADAQCGNDDHAERRETGVIGDHFGHESHQGRRAEHIGDGNLLASRRVDIIKGEIGKNHGNDTGDKECGNKQHGNVGNFIADPFNPAEESPDFLGLYGFRGCVWHRNKHSFLLLDIHRWGAAAMLYIYDRNQHLQYTMSYIIRQMYEV